MKKQKTVRCAQPVENQEYSKCIEFHISENFDEVPNSLRLLIVKFGENVGNLML